MLLCVWRGDGAGGWLFLKWLSVLRPSLSRWSLQQEASVQDLEVAAEADPTAAAQESAGTCQRRGSRG